MEIKDAHKKIKKSHYVKHETKRSVLSKFLLILAIFIVYFIIISFEYGLNNGLSITLLTWSFFVFCTPIVGAGLLLDFPMRLLLKVRMIYTEICVWGIAFLINIYHILLDPTIYQKTVLLSIFNKILFTPIPFWLIIILSGIGTFLSVYFGDELIDVAKHRHRKKFNEHKEKHKIIIIVFLIVATIFLYNILLKKLGLNVF